MEIAAEKFISSTDGAKIYAEAHGDPSNPALILTAGYGFNYLCFEKQLALAEHVYLVRQALLSVFNLCI